MARVAGAYLSRFYQEDLRAHGLELQVNSQIDALVGEGRVNGVRLNDGEVVPAQMVIVGIGILPDVFAVGDCAAHANRFANGAVVRLESVQIANDMAMVVTKNICGEVAEYGATPWFWSNQYDLKLQTVGLSAGHAKAITRGDPATR